MKRFMRVLASAVLSIGVVLSAAPSAQAQQPVINCSAHMLDATAQQGIDIAYVNRHVDMFKSRVPTTKIYVQAYEQMPGGSADAFWKMAKQQCANWLDPSGTRVKDNIFVVVYGHNVDSVGLFHGYNLDITMAYEDLSIANGVASNLGPERSQVNPDYVSQALVQSLLSMRFYVQQSHWFSKGAYHPPAYADTGGSNEFQPLVVGGWIISVVAFMALLGLVLQGLKLLGRRLFGPLN
jgi:hypothetical protein